MSWSEKTNVIIAEREKCPMCGGNVRLISIIEPIRYYQIRCRPCDESWPLKTPVEITPGAVMISDATVIRCIREWNEIARKEKEKNE